MWRIQESWKPNFVLNLGLHRRGIERSFRTNIRKHQINSSISAFVGKVYIRFLDNAEIPSGQNRFSFFFLIGWINQENRKNGSIFLLVDWRFFFLCSLIQRLEYHAPLSFEQALAMGRTGRVLPSPVLNGFKPNGALHARHSDSDEEDWC